MSVSDPTAATRPDAAPFIRDAEPTDYPAIRHVVIAAYAQYARLIPADIFSPYLADLTDLETHARHGRLFVVEVDDQIRGFAAFHPDATVQGVGFPPGWASGRALAVHPSGRSHGVARALLATGERLAREAGAPVFAFHTHSYMTGAFLCTRDSATAGRRSSTSTWPPATADSASSRSCRSPTSAT